MRYGMKSMLAFLLVFSLFIFFSGCIAITFPGEGEEVPEEVDATQLCIDLCKEIKAKGIDLSAGPCLSNEIFPDWVCDVAHDPRQAIDNQPENQCSAFRDGKAHHFVEVTENCELIRKY